MLIYLVSFYINFRFICFQFVTVFHFIQFFESFNQFRINSNSKNNENNIIKESILKILKELKYEYDKIKKIFKNIINSSQLINLSVDKRQKMSQIQKKNCVRITNPQKMRTFLDILHKKYEILSKLTQKQQQNFHNEVILLLVDQQENVDQNAYNQVIKNIGIDAFVLDILGKSINRNPFSNSYEMKKNIQCIAEDLQKQTKQILKKTKIIQRKQAQLNSRQNNLKNKLKQYAQQLEKQYVNRMLVKQNEIKKNITNLLNNLKLKQKIITDRKQQICKKLIELSVKEKAISAKQKQIKKNIQSPVTNQQQNTMNRVHNDQKSNIKQLKQIQKKYEQVKTQLQKMKKKYKTTEMAYSKSKNDLVEKQNQSKTLLNKIQQLKQQLKIQREKQKEKDKEKQLEGKNKNNSKNKEIGNRIQNIQQRIKNTQDRNNPTQLITILQQLQISMIQQQKQQIPHKISTQTKTIKQTIQKYRRNICQNKKKQVNVSAQPQQPQQLIVEHRFSKTIKQKQNNKQVQTLQQQNIKLFDHYFTQSNNDNQKQFLQHKQQSILYSKQISTTNPQNQIKIPQFLQQSQDNQFNQQSSAHAILQNINNILNTSNSSTHNKLLSSNLLKKFIKLQSFHHSKSNLIKYYDILLTLIQQSHQHYYETIQYISVPQFTNFFQKSYINYESYDLATLQDYDGYYCGRCVL